MVRLEFPTYPRIPSPQTMIQLLCASLFPNLFPVSSPWNSHFSLEMSCHPIPPPPQKKKDGKISKPNFFQNMLSVCRSKQLKESEIYKCPALTALSNSIFWISSQSLEAGFGWTRELRAHMLRETQKFVHMYCRYFVDVGGFKTHLKKNFRQ